MANKYCNLDGTKKISQEYGKINVGFDKVEADILVERTRVDGKFTKVESDIVAESNRVDTKIAKVESDIVAESNRVDTKIAEVEFEIANIIVTPTSGINEQEIIVARGEFKSLGLRLNNLGLQTQELKNFLGFMPIDGGDFDGNEPINVIIDGGTY